MIAPWRCRRRGHAAIEFAIAAGHFVIALVRRGGSLSVEGLASEETLKIIEVDFDALDQYQPGISALAPNARPFEKPGRKMPSPGWIRITWRHSRRSVERRGPVTSDWCRPSAPMLDPAISICAPKVKRKRPFAPAAICASTTRVRVFFWVSGLKLAPVSASARCSKDGCAIIDRPAHDLSSHPGCQCRARAREP
jgi:hypothetical protein